MSIIFVIFASLCWGLAGGLAGVLIADGWDPFTVALYRGAIGLIMVLFWLALSPGRSGLASMRMCFWSVIAGLGIAGNFSFYFVSISEGSIAIAAMLMYCAPVFVYLVSFALRIERSSPFKWMAIAMVVIGVILLTRIYDVNAGSVTALGIGAGLLSGVSYAVFIFGLKYASPHGSPQAILVVAFTVLVVVLVWPANSEQTIAVLDSSRWPLFLALGVLGAGLPFFLYIIGLRRALPTVAAILAMIEPVTASLFGYLVLDQTMVGLQILGMAIILITIAALSWRQTRE